MGSTLLGVRWYQDGTGTRPERCVKQLKPLVFILESTQVAPGRSERERVMWSDGCLRKGSRAVPAFQTLWPFIPKPCVLRAAGLDSAADAFRQAVHHAHCSSRCRAHDQYFRLLWVPLAALTPPDSWDLHTDSSLGAQYAEGRSMGGGEEAGRGKVGLFCEFSFGSEDTRLRQPSTCRRLSIPIRAFPTELSDICK